MKTTRRARPRSYYQFSASGSEDGTSDHLHRKKRRSGSTRLFVIFIVIAVVILLLVSLPAFVPSSWLRSSVRVDTTIAESTCERYTFDDTKHSGFKAPPVDSTVLMLYTPTNKADSFCYSDGSTAGNTTVEQEFLRVAASYVSSPYTKPSSPYHDFFSAHDATLWTVDRAAGVATPMRLDVVYTYVNPSAPSFERHLKMRNVPFEQRRYRDWEELRYSLRSLRAFMLDNDALAQYHRRHAADVRRLGELGYRVNASDVVEGNVVPLVRRVYLVVSDVDQVPAWLDAEKFPQLRVVTHRDMFTAEEAAWVLPTMNSNVIESGMHRIRDVSRFFLYFTNDMFVGRKMSFFDLFRPLSPLRQRLHLHRLAQGVQFFPENVIHGEREPSRAVMFLEPIVHSDTQNIKSAERDQEKIIASTRQEVATEELHSCFYKKIRKTIDDVGSTDRWSAETATMPSYATTEVFALPDPHQGVSRGAGVSMKYFHYIASKRIHGVQPPFGYAHIPQLIDRDVFGRLADVELFDLTNNSRGAYEREMSPFGVINLYAVFAAAMTRAAEREIWNKVWRPNADSAFIDVRDELQRWWWDNVAKHSQTVIKDLVQLLSHEMDMAMFGALYGNTWGAQLQRPDLALEMGYWWVRNAVSPAGAVRELSSLKTLYTIPEVSSDKTCRTQASEWASRSDDHYFSLLHDMFHHTKRDETFLFEMVDSEVKTMLIAARLKYEWLDRPLFMGFNDNFSPNANFQETKSIFSTLMSIVVGGADAAPWER